MSSYSVITYATTQMPLTYRALIFSKWLRSLRYGNDFFRLINAEAYYKFYQRYIAGIMASGAAHVRLAVLTDDPDVVLGFLIHRGPVLDYVHVHRDQRRLGIGTKLLPTGIKTITHLTNTGLRIWGSKYREWAFNPFA